MWLFALCSSVNFLCRDVFIFVNYYLSIFTPKLISHYDNDHIYKHVYNVLCKIKTES